MRNKRLHDALRDFALESAALLSSELAAAGGALQFDVAPASARGSILYSYSPRTAEFIVERWDRLRTLPTASRAAVALGTGAAAYMRLQGLRGEDPEPALRAMLERIYEDASSFEFPEERFERVYEEVEGTLYASAARSTIAAALDGVWLSKPGRVEIGENVALVSGDLTDAPPQAVWPDGVASRHAEPRVLVLIEDGLAAGETVQLDEARERLRELVTALRLFKAGAPSLDPLGWHRTDAGPWQPFAIHTAGAGHGEPWVLHPDELGELHAFLRAIEPARCTGAVEWALDRYEMGLERDEPTAALSDHLLALRALLEGPLDAAGTPLALRLAALCAEEPERMAMQQRIERALALERFVAHGGFGAPYVDAVGAVPPAEIAAEVAEHLRALLRDVLCGYLGPDLHARADAILLSVSEPFEIEARDIRPRSGGEPGEDDDPDTEELEPVAVEPEPVPGPDEIRVERLSDPAPAPSLAAITQPPPSPTAAADDWDDAADFSAPV